MDLPPDYGWIPSTAYLFISQGACPVNPTTGGLPVHGCSFQQLAGANLVASLNSNPNYPIEIRNSTSACVMFHAGQDFQGNRGFNMTYAVYTNWTGNWSAHCDLPNVFFFMQAPFAVISPMCAALGGTWGPPQMPWSPSGIGALIFVLDQQLTGCRGVAQSTRSHTFARVRVCTGVCLWLLLRRGFSPGLELRLHGELPGGAGGCHAARFKPR
jgi:hypothetical protein